MGEIVFEGSFIRLEQAHRCFQSLDQEIKSFFGRGAWSVIKDVDSKPGYERHLVTVKEPIPRLWAPSISDIVHNLRASLDLLACQLAAMNSGSPTGVSFSISLTAEKFDRKAISKLSAAAQTKIEGVQPFSTKEDTLYLLHEFDRLSKHRLIIPVVGAYTEREFLAELTFPGGQKIKLDGMKDFAFDPVFPVTDGQELIVVERRTGDSNSEIKADLGFAHRFALSFGPNSPFEGKKVRPTLVSMLDTVEKTLRAFEADSALLGPTVVRT